MRRIPRLLLAVLIAIGSMSVPMPARALPETWFETNYYYCHNGYRYARELTTCSGWVYVEGETGPGGCGNTKQIVERHCQTGEILNVETYRSDGCEWLPAYGFPYTCWNCPC